MLLKRLFNKKLENVKLYDADLKSSSGELTYEELDFPASGCKYFCSVNGE